MQQWEYMIWRVRGSNVLSVVGVLGGDLEATTVTTAQFHDALNAAGKKGWELAGTIPGQQSGETTLVLKRPRREVSAR